jgi:hypothetical protein
MGFFNNRGHQLLILLNSDRVGEGVALASAEGESITGVIMTVWLSQEKGK